MVTSILFGCVYFAGPSAADSTHSIPVDGRLRGQDFAATVTSVAWPDQTVVDGRTEEAPPDHRYVVFGLSLSENPASITPAGTPPITAKVTSGQSSVPVSLAGINDQIIQAGTGSNWPSGSSQFSVAVGNTAHDVDLVITEGSFSQSFNLWTLLRTPPAPIVLYRDPTLPTLTGSGGTPATLALTNPADGFSSSASVSVQSATLGYFAANGASASPGSPDQAVLSVALDGEFPNDPADPSGSGRYLGAQAPLPASMLSFTSSGGSAAPATMSNAGDTTGKGSRDDGLFDATYNFVVPGNTTSGAITVGAGTFSGAEFTLYTAETGNTTLAIEAPISLALSFRAVPVAVAQKKPPWVGQPLPPTAQRVTGGSRSGNQSHGPPIWLALVVLALVAVAIVIVQRRRQRTSAPATSATTPDPTSTPTPPRSAGVGPLVRTVDPQTRTDPEVVTPAVAGAATGEVSALTVNVLGPVQILGPLHKSMRGVVKELFVYLVLHDHRHLRVGQIRIGMWPTRPDREDIADKTLRNYLYELRSAIGAEHLPDASGTKGYLIEGVASDWAAFQRLDREADAAGGTFANELRTEALALVRGLPFEDVADVYEFVGEERLDVHMALSIAACAHRLGSDLLEGGDFVGAEGAATAGLRGAPDEYDLWLLGARAIFARGDRTALRHWMAEASRHLDSADVARIEDALGLGHDPDQS